MASPLCIAATKTLAAAVAGMLAVAGLALATRSSGSDPDPVAPEVLLTAARATEEVGSAEVRVTGYTRTETKLGSFPERISETAESLPPVPPPVPSPPPAPPIPPELDCGDMPGRAGEMPLHAGEMPEHVCERLRERMESARARAHAEARSELREHRSEMRSRIRAHMEEHLARIPDEIRCELEFEGSGTMSIPGTIDVDGDADVACDPDIVDAEGTFGASLSMHGGWDGFPMPPFSDGTSVPALLRGADGEVTGHGTEQMDGVTVRHVSFSTDHDRVSTSVDAWIGVDDHVVRKLVTRTSGHLGEEGVEVELEARQTLLVTDVVLGTSSKR